ncbi:MAG: secretion system protein E, partial [Dehalococcoidia bacterium]|nr:secretion system protein E [Dehalococcoidia bacterium]
MATSGLPFPCENTIDTHDGKQPCTLIKLLPKSLREQAEAVPHLMDYLHMVPISKVGVPEFYPEVSRKLSEIEHPNLIYPVSDDAFVHIFPDLEDPRNYYIAIDPPVGMEIEDVLKEVERRLLDFVDILAQAETTEEKANALAEAVDLICVVKGDDRPSDDGEDGKKKSRERSPRSSGRGGRIPVTRRELEILKYVILRDKIGMGALDPLIKDTNIEDISCSGLGRVFVEHKVFKGLKSSIVFDTHEELDDFVLRLSENIKKPATFKNPIV